METEPVAPQHFQSMPFNPFSAHQFNQQQQQQHQMNQQMMLLQQQQLISQQHQQQQQSQQIDEEMEMADDNTCDMKYSENDMNVTNSQSNHLQQLHKNHQDEQLLQQIHNSQLHNSQIQSSQISQQQQQQHQQQFNQQKFGRLDNADFVKKDKLLDEDESYDEDDEDYDDEEDDLDDYDEHLVQEMMLSAAPEVQNIIKLIISGFSACATETLRYLVEEENLGVNSPLMVGLIDHLKTQETMLIVNCLRTQQYQAQLIKQHQQQILASQLLGNKQVDPKMIDPKMIDPKLLSQLANQTAIQQQAVQQPTVQQLTANQATGNQQASHQMPTQPQQLKSQHKKGVANPQSMLSQQQQQQQQQQLLAQQQKAAQQPNHSSSNQRLAGNLTNTRLPNSLNGSTGGSLSPNHGPLTSSPINKPFEQLNSINVNNLNHLSNFNSNLHSAFGSSQSTHSSVNSQNSSAQNSQSNSPIHTPPLHLQNGNFNAGQQPNPFASQPAGFGNNPNFAGNTSFFNQTSGVLSSFKPPFNDSGFSE